MAQVQVVSEHGDFEETVNQIDQLMSEYLIIKKMEKEVSNFNFLVKFQSAWERNFVSLKF